MNTYNKHTVFRTVHSIYEHNDNIVPCIVAFTPCNDMTMTPNLAEYELQDIFDTFDYLLKNQFDLFAKCEQRSRVDWDSFLRVFRKQPLLKFAKLIIDNSDDINDEYAVISALYLMCKNPNFATLADAGFKLEKITIS